MKGGVRGEVGDTVDEEGGIEVDMVEEEAVLEEEGEDGDAFDVKICVQHGVWVVYTPVLYISTNFLILPFLVTLRFLCIRDLVGPA